MVEYLSQEGQQKLNSFESFLHNELKPLEEKAKMATEANNKSEFRTLRKQVTKRSSELGFFKMTQPKSIGGQPATQLEIIAFQEALSTANVPMLSSSVFGPGAGMLGRATGELRERYLMGVLRGELRGSFGFTEPPDVVERTVAVEDGDDLVITGQKSYVTGGDTADFVSAFCNLRSPNGEKQGNAMVVIDIDSPGVTIERVFSSMDDNMKHAYLSFNNVRVPKWRILGGKSGGNSGMKNAMRQIGNVRLSLSAQAVGTAKCALDYTRTTLNAPHRSGSPLSTREGVRIRYAELYAEYYAARSMLYHTAQLAQQGEDINSKLKATKIFCTEMANKVVDGCLQLSGGMAVTVGHPLEALYRQVRVWKFTEGASDLLRIQLAEDVLSSKL